MACFVNRFCSTPDIYCKFCKLQVFYCKNEIGIVFSVLQVMRREVLRSVKEAGRFWSLPVRRHTVCRNKVFPFPGGIFLFSSGHKGGRAQVLHVEQKVHDVAVAHRVILAFHTQGACGPAGGFGLVSHVVVKADDLGPDKALFKVGMDNPGGLRRFPAAAEGPGPHLFPQCRTRPTFPSDPRRADPAIPLPDERRF